ncbi:MAG: hypothetical protein GOU97_03805 [Nanoarchaeota archaeon]|nr:hypothetical protein [Nanoarchaeota archaeon]
MYDLFDVELDLIEIKLGLYSISSLEKLVKRYGICIECMNNSARTVPDKDEWKCSTKYLVIEKKKVCKGYISLIEFYKKNLTL